MIGPEYFSIFSGDHSVLRTIESMLSPLRSLACISLTVTLDWSSCDVTATSLGWLTSDRRLSLIRKVWVAPSWDCNSRVDPSSDLPINRKSLTSKECHTRHGFFGILGARGSVI